jgi:hypothetical protein
VEEKTSYILMNPVRRECVSVLRNGFGFFVRIIVRRGVTSSGRARTPMRAEVCPGTACRGLPALPKHECLGSLPRRALRSDARHWR